MRVALALLFGAMGWAAASTVHHPPPPYFENAAQDKTGILWAYSRSEYNSLYSYDGTAWLKRSGPFNQNQSAMPAFVVPMTDGSVAAVWRVEPHLVGVTRSDADGVHLIGTCPGEINSGGLSIQPFADSQNRLWITTESSAIYRADSTGVKLVHTIAPNEFVSPGHSDGFNKVHAIEDGHQRIWVWCDPTASNYSSLLGVLIFTGDHAELHTSFGLIDGKKILTVANADDHHMWVAVANDGLYRVDIDNFTLEREPDPEPKVFCCVHEMHQEGADLFAIADYPIFKHSLWRKHDGKWTKLIDPIGTYPYWPRSWLKLPQGILLQGDENAAWFISHDGLPHELSWKTGFPLSRAHAFARLSNGHIWAIGSDKLYDAPLELPPKTSTNSRLVWVPAERGWKLDAAGRVWAILKATPQELSEWDGDKWIGHKMPAPIPANQMPTMEGDERGQMWVEAADTRGVQIHEPVSDTWTTYASMDDAYLALGHQPPQFLKTGVLDYEGPVYSPDLKHVAYRRGAAYIFYYDGAKWVHFDRHNITGKNEDNAVGPPAFDSSGGLLVNLRPKFSYRMDVSGKWSEIPFRSLYPDDMWSEGGHHPNLSRVEPPEGAPKPFDFCVKDNVGTWWLTAKGQLYRAVPGTCVAQFGAGEVNPFLAHPGLGRIFVDKNGNALFDYGSETDPFLMLRPKRPPPLTQVTLHRTAPDSFTAHLDPKTTGQVTYRWQLDDGEWQQGSAADLPLDHLPNGAHVLRVSAMTQTLDLQAAPTVAKFETKIDAKQQLADLIAQLADSNYERRKQAVDALSQQPATAIPALQEARATATSDQQWWIDVALQEAQGKSVIK